MAEPNPQTIETGSDVRAPPIAAAFLVNFDHRKGYTLAWHKSIDGVQVEGVVEFKSLPSGLHNVEEDLVYFIHEDYAGLSAFLNKPDERSERKARLLAIGVLVPLDHGRIGRSWRHAEALRELTRAQIENVEDTSQLEKYWEKYKLRQEDRPTEAPNESAEYFGRSNGYRKSRAMSTATTYLPSDHHLTAHHPATTLLQSVKLFGPLIFPLFRAALLRKRILIITEAPVEFSCNLVYNLSILSSVSRSLLPLFRSAGIPNPRLHPLFSVGVSDMSLLEKPKGDSESNLSSQDGWIACTTDDVLSTKPDLYDVLVLMPPSESEHARTKVFPRIVNSTPSLTRAFPKTGIKSTQRDFHRYVHLQQGLRRYPVSQITDNETSSTANEETSSFSSHTSTDSAYKTIVESPSWSRVAYTSLIWWASAGDRRGGFPELEEIESERDLALLQDDSDDAQIREVALVAYFHRMANLIFETIVGAVARADGRSLEDGAYQDELGGDSPVDQTSLNPELPAQEDENQALLADQDEDYNVEITQEEMTTMGLDAWSISDTKFIEELVELWCGRKATVQAASVECCGLRIL